MTEIPTVRVPREDVAFRCSTASAASPWLSLKERFAGCSSAPPAFAAMPAADSPGVST